MLYQIAALSLLFSIISQNTLATANPIHDGVGIFVDLSDIKDVAQNVASYAYDYSSTNVMCEHIEKLTKIHGDNAMMASHHAHPYQCCVTRKQAYLPLAVIQLSTLLPWTPSFKAGKRTEGIRILAEEALKMPENDLKESLSEAADWMSTRAGQACETGLRLYQPDKPIMPY